MLNGKAVVHEVKQPSSNLSVLQSPGTPSVLKTFNDGELNGLLSSNKQTQFQSQKQPKERRKRGTIHEPSVRLSNRTFAVQDNAVEYVEVGDAIEASVSFYLLRLFILLCTDILRTKGTEILQTLAADPEPRPALKKKEKHQLKRDAFLQRMCSKFKLYDPVSYPT